MAIEHVSDTARWVAVYRAMETERPDAIFRDPYARKLAGARGQAIVDEMKHGRSMAWAMIVRTQLFDEVILETIRREKVDLVVNLACGLDARAWRLDVPPELRWVDVDFPVMIDYKTEVMKNERPVCRYEAISADLTNDAARSALFATLGASAQRVMVVSEGLLIYLTPEQVGTLARDLHAQSAFRWWMIDLASPQLLQRMTKMWGGDVTGGNAPFLFAPADGTAFFAEHGWRERTYYGTMENAQRLKREMRGMWMYKIIGAVMGLFASKESKAAWKRFSGCVLLERI
jgi:methyltransferase (TIGR00027 family)